MISAPLLLIFLFQYGYLCPAFTAKHAAAYQLATALMAKADRISFFARRIFLRRLSLRNHMGIWYGVLLPLNGGFSRISIHWDVLFPLAGQYAVIGPAPQQKKCRKEPSALKSKDRKHGQSRENAIQKRNDPGSLPLNRPSFHGTTIYDDGQGKNSANK